MLNVSLKAPLSLVTAAGVAMALSTTGVYAAKTGPRAGVNVQTTCALTNGNLDVTVNVTDKTSGSAVAVVDAYSISPAYKSQADKGNTTTAIPGMAVGSDTNMLVNSGLTIKHSVDLCEALSVLPTDLRAVNADVAVSFGADDGAGGVADVRTIVNSCSDDPTTEVIEPSGIRVNYDELATACAAR
ncbi:MAG: hypothetical protein OEY07_07350 [Gammaproteobacteria bacterium]|nr:hypothetical protein [Gammaproteobacteria bacterium]